MELGELNEFTPALPEIDQVPGPSTGTANDTTPKDAIHSWYEDEDAQIKVFPVLARKKTGDSLNPFVLPAAYNTEIHTHGIPNDPKIYPFPHGSDGTISFENARKRLRGMPQFIMDYEGFVPNSEIRELLEKCYANYLSIREDRAPPAPIKFASLRACALGFKQEVDEIEKIALTQRLLKHIKIKKPKLQMDKLATGAAAASNRDAVLDAANVARKEADVIANQLAVTDDEFMVDDADRLVDKEDAARLRKVKREVTQGTIIQKTHDKTERLKEQETISASHLDTSSYIDLPELVTEEPDLSVVAVMTRADVDKTLLSIRLLVGGSESSAVELIVGALNGKTDNIASLSAVMPNSSLRQAFLRSVTQPGYAFYLLSLHFNGARTVFNMLDIVLDESNPKRTVQRFALSKKLNYVLGEKTGNSRLMQFASALNETCEEAIGCLKGRMKLGHETVASAFHECLCGEDIQMVEFAEAAHLTPEQLDKIVLLTCSCQRDALVAYINELPIVGSEKDSGSPTSTFRTEPRGRADMMPLMEGSSGGAVGGRRSKVIPIEIASEEGSVPTVGKSGKAGRFKKGRKRTDTTEDSEETAPSTVRMVAPPLTAELPTGPAFNKASQRGLLLKGKLTKKTGGGGVIPRSARGANSTAPSKIIFSEPLDAILPGAGHITLSDISQVDQDQTLDDDSSIEEEATQGPSLELPEMLSSGESEDGGENSVSGNGEEAEDGVQYDHDHRHRHRHHRRHHHHHRQGEELGDDDVDEEASPTDDGRETSETGAPYSNISESIPEHAETRPMTGAEAASRAAEEEAACMNILTILKMATTIEDAQEILKKVVRVIRNDEGTMDVEAIIRIHHEMNSLTRYLEQQMTELAHADVERAIVRGIIDLIKSTANELVPADMVPDKKDEVAIAVSEDANRPDRLRARLEAMVKRRKPPKLRPQTKLHSVASTSSSGTPSSVVSGAVFGITPKENPVVVNPSNSPQRGNLTTPIEIGVFTVAAPTKVAALKYESLTAKKVSSEAGIHKEEEKQEEPPNEPKPVEQNQLAQLPKMDEQREEEAKQQANVPGVAEITIGKISSDKLHPGIHLDSKLVQSIKRKSLGFSRALLKDDVWRRQQTRLLIEMMQRKIRGASANDTMGSDADNSTTRALTPNQIREMLSNPDFEEIALEFKNLYGSEILRSGGGAVLAKIMNQMDRISTKVGEEPEIDKMVNLLSVIKAQDRKFTAGELLDEYFEELSPDEMKYLDDMLNVVKELLLVELAITHALVPHQRLAWMSMRDNWDNQRNCLAILGQLMQLQVISPDIGSIIVSSLVMNVFDVIAAFNARDIISSDAEKMIYGYIKDEIEALAWFGVHVSDNTEVLKPLAEEYDYDIGSVMAGEDNPDIIRPSMDKSLLDLVIAPGYMYVLKTGVEKGFAVSKVDDRSDRVAFIEYMLRLRQAGVRAAQKKQTPYLSPVEVMAHQIDKVALSLRSSATVAAALETTSMQEAAFQEFKNIYCRVVPASECKKANKVFQLGITACLRTRKDELEGLLFTRDTDNDILGDLEETSGLLKSAPAGKGTTNQAAQRMVYQLYNFGREISTVDPNEVTRVLAYESDGERLYTPLKMGAATNIRPHQHMYTIQDAKDRNVTSVNFPGLEHPFGLHNPHKHLKRDKSPARDEHPRTPVHLPHINTSDDGAFTHYETTEVPSLPISRQRLPNASRHLKGLWRTRSSDDVLDPNEPISLHYSQTRAYREGRTLHVASHGYPLKREEVAAVEASLPPSPTLPGTLWEAYSLLRGEQQPSPPPPPTKSHISLGTATNPSTNGTTTTAQQRSSGMEQEAANTLLSDMAVVHFLARNPAAVLEQLRQRLKPGGLTDVLDDIIENSSSRKSKKLFIQALQRAVNAEKELKGRCNWQHNELQATTGKGRLVKRPLTIPTRDWQRLAKTETSVTEKLPPLRPDQHDSLRPVHCKADFFNRAGFPKANLPVANYLSRGNVLEHIQKSNHIRAHERIQNSIVECILRVASQLEPEDSKRSEFGSKLIFKLDL